MNNYKSVKVDGKKTDEHRNVMEAHLGRKLTAKEIVHHRDGDKRNNDPENLLVMSLSEHTKLHFPDGPVHDGVAINAQIEARMKWTKEKTLQLIAMLSVGSKKVAIAKCLGVNRKFVHKIAAKKSWVFEYYGIPT